MQFLMTLVALAITILLLAIYPLPVLAFTKIDIPIPPSNQTLELGGYKELIHSINPTPITLDINKHQAIAKLTLKLN